ncbi:Calcineurin-like phosphoesterase superfamily domain protein [uncultured archaeon]|nr:Calcineurin-like phosphoesterase superfamily domain protein [uncultured archaeon]
MKIIHISDIHHDIKTLESFMKLDELNSCDCIVMTGDVAGPISKDESYQFDIESREFERVSQAWQNDFRKWDRATLTKNKISTFEDYVDFFKERFPDNSEVITYTTSLGKIKSAAIKQYKEVRNVLDRFTGRKIAVHGNWDSTEFFEIFGDMNIHRKNVTIDSLKFWGYGGSPYSYNPFRLAVPAFNENVMHDELLKEMPDMVLTHAPPRKMTDTGNTSKSLLGSGMLRSYIYESYIEGKAPLVIFSGHSHSPGIERDKKTNVIVSNPGNLGVSEREHYGTFNLIEIKGREIIHAKTYALSKNGAVLLEGDVIPAYEKREHSMYRTGIKRLFGSD